MSATERPLVAPDDGPVDDPARPDAAPGAGGRGGLPTWIPVPMVAGGGYILLSLALWWHIWTADPASTTTCGCGDSSLFQWFLAWPAYAISHGLNPWFSTAQFYPHGINLVSNTAVEGVGIVLAPVTWLFGPIMTFNVASGAAPALSAFTMFVLLRRWGAWAPAAFFGGLLYGFSPFFLFNLTNGTLMLSMAPIPPLLVLCLDELLARQRRGPVLTGGLLGVLVAVQFFISTEVLILVGIAAAIGVVLVILYAAFHRDVRVRRTRYAVIGLASAGVTAAVLLAYPTWFALAGPAHLSGPIWGPTSAISYEGTRLHDYFLPGASFGQGLASARTYGGYQALTRSGQYVGIGLVIVLVAGLVVWRRDLRLWLFAIVGVLSVPLSMTLSVHGTWTLWSIFVRLPLMDDVLPGRFVLVTYLCAAVMLGLVLDHLRTGVGRCTEARTSASDGVRLLGTGWRRAGSWAAIGAALVAIVPIFAYYVDGLPFTTQPVVVPAWFRTVAPHLDSRQVVLAFPVPFALRQSALTWQAVEGMSFSQVGGGGPESILTRAGTEADGQAYIGDVSLMSKAGSITEEGVASSRQALDGWGVTIIVIPDTGRLPTYEQLHSVRSSVMLMTAATGSLPFRQADAWVRTDVESSPPSRLLSAASYAGCNRGPQEGSIASIQRSAACVLAAPLLPR